MKPTLSRRIEASRPSSIAVISVPPPHTLPRVGLSRAPAMVRRVVLPDPDGPITSTTSPPYAWRLTSCRAVTALSPEPNILLTSSSLRITSADTELPPEHGERVYLGQPPDGDA